MATNDNSDYRREIILNNIENAEKYSNCVIQKVDLFYKYYKEYKDIKKK